MYQVKYTDGIELRVIRGGSCGEIVSKRGTLLFAGAIAQCYEWLKTFGARCVS